MKLFLKQDHKEGEAYPQNVFLSWGNKYQVVHEEKDVIPGMGMKAINHVWKKNGFYFKIEIPFSITRDYIDPHNFLYRTGKCRPNILFWKRMSRGDVIKGVVRGMLPVNMEKDPLNVQRNLKEFGEIYKETDRAAVQGIAQ